MEIAILKSQEMEWTGQGKVRYGEENSRMI